VYNLVSVDQIKDFSKGEFSSAHDPLLDSIIIPAINETCAKYCRRSDFDKAARIEFFSPEEKQKFLWLSAPPVAESPVIQVWQDTSLPRTYAATTLLVKGSDYFVDERLWCLEKRAGWAHGTQTVKVSYTGGYLTDHGIGTPDDLQLAALMQSKIIYDRREELGVTSRSLEGGSLAMLTRLMLPDAITSILNKYKLDFIC
jgi:hypothetical protein